MDDFTNFSSYEAKRRPDQQTYKLNQMRQQLMTQKYQLVVNSADGKQKIIIGQQPKPYEKLFGIFAYKVEGDKLTQVPIETL